MYHLLIRSILALLVAITIASCTSPMQDNTVRLKPFEELLFMKNYPDFDGAVNSYLQNMMAESQKFNLSNFKSSDPQWICQGPYNIGGRINTIACNPKNPSVIYTGSVCGGIFKTTNGGQSWFPVFDQQAFLAISHIVISPYNDSIIYVGTGDPNIGGYAWVGNGIYRSIDAGNTWQHLGLENVGIVSKIAVHPQNPQIIYAATMGIPFVRDENRGLYKSSDGGSTWQKVLYLSNQAGIIDLVMLPSSPDTLIVAGWDRVRNYNESLATGPNCRLYRTMNGGETWDTLTNGLPQTAVSRIGLTISTRDSLQIFAQFVDGNSYEQEGIYRSSDVGSTWTKLPAEIFEEGILGGFGWYFGKIRVNPQNPNQQFILGVDLYRSDDGGQSFYMVSPPWYTYEVHADKHDLVFIDSTTILLSTDGGLYRSPDAGVTWFDIENIPNTQFYRVAVDPHYPGFYSGGAQDNGTSYGNVSDSANWSRLLGGDGFQPVFDWNDSSLIYGETQNGNLYWAKRNADNIEWDYFDSSIDETDRRSWDMPYCMSKQNNKIMYCGTYRMLANYQSPTDDWQPISDDLTDGTNSRYHVITSIDVSPFTDSLLMSGSSDGKVYVYDSIAWTDVSAGLPVRYVTRVKFSPNSRKHLFVTHSGYRANEYIPHIHYSQDFGQTWTDISGNLPQLGINSIHVLKGYHDSVIFVATDGGIYHTLNLGTTWQRTGSGMPVIPVYDLAYDDTNHTLVAGTFARSLMTLKLDEIVKKYVPPVVAVKPILANVGIWPNPATHFITINLSEEAPGLSISLIDYSGRVFINQSIEGKNERIDVQNLPVGCYVLVIRNKSGAIRNEKIVIQ